MKLADDPLKVQSTKVGEFHARALREIGQDLADLFPEKLEIERHDENFIVRGQCARSRLKTKAPKPGWASFKEFLSRDVTALPSETKPESVPFERTYNPQDILQLNEAGIRHRTGITKVPDIRSLGEILRTVGRLVDAENTRLIRIFKDKRRIRFEYQKAGGTTISQEVSSLDLHKLQQRYYELRGKRTMIDLWENRL